MPSLGLQKLEPRVGNTSTRVSALDTNIPPVPGGGNVRLRFGRRLVNTVAQWTNALTEGILREGGGVRSSLARALLKLGFITMPLKVIVLPTSLVTVTAGRLRPAFTKNRENDLHSFARTE